jgi:hypothetical protein
MKEQQLRFHRGYYAMEAEDAEEDEGEAEEEGQEVGCPWTSVWLDLGDTTLHHAYWRRWLRSQAVSLYLTSVTTTTMEDSDGDGAPHRHHQQQPDEEQEDEEDDDEEDDDEEVPHGHSQVQPVLFVPPVTETTAMDVDDEYVEDDAPIDSDSSV